MAKNAKTVGGGNGNKKEIDYLKEKFADNKEDINVIHKRIDRNRASIEKIDDKLDKFIMDSHQSRRITSDKLNFICGRIKNGDQKNNIS